MRILIPVLHRFGDMILTTPIFRTIKNQFPDAEISVIASKENKIIIENNPLINKIYIFDKSPISIIKLILQIKSQKFDFYIDSKDHYSSESNLLAKIVNAKNKIGFQKDNKSPFNININLDSNSETHFIDNLNNSLSSLNIKTNNYSRTPELYINPEIDQYYFELFKFIIKPIVLINLSAGKQNRKLTENQWNLIINKIPDIYSKLIISDKNDEEIAIKLANIYKIKHCKTENIQEVTAIIKFCDCIITPDTAIVHIASAFNIPIIAFYNGIKVNTKRFYPLSKNHLVIESKENDDFINNIPIESYLDNIVNFLNSIIN